MTHPNDLSVMWIYVTLVVDLGVFFIVLYQLKTRYDSNITFNDFDRSDIFVLFIFNTPFSSSYFDKYW